jgi:6-phosphofructokinase 2
MKRIVTLTLNPALDVSTSVESVASEIKLRCTTPEYDPGGGGINVSRAIKKLGGDSLAIFTAGGGNGTMLTELVEREAIQCEPVPISGLTRQSFTAFERTTTLQYRFNLPGPELSAAELDRCTQAILAQHADYVVASGSLPPGVPDDFYATLTQAAEAQGSRVIIDTSGKALEAMLRGGAFLLKPNIGELETLSGKKFTGEDQLKDTAQALIAQGMAEVLVISLGAGGAALVTRDLFVSLRPPVVPVQSKVGAGDSMVGGLTLALAQERDLVDAVRYGVASGTAAVMTSGTDLCRKEDVEAVYPRVMVIH